MLMDLLTDASILSLLSFAALLTVYSGWLSLSLDAFITLGAYVFFCVFLSSKSQAVAFLCSLSVTATIAFLSAGLTWLFKTPPLLSSLSFSLIIEGAVRAFGGGKSERLSGKSFLINEPSVILASLALSALLIFFLLRTRRGLYMRLSGENKELLALRGISSFSSESLSWTLSASAAGAAGAFLCALLESYSPGMSSSRGWFALCIAVSASRKNARIFVLSFFFSLLNRFSAMLSSSVPALPPLVSVSLPYLACALLLFIFYKN